MQVDEEYKSPGSQKREALGKMPQMWGQSLYVLASLVKEVCRFCDVQSHRHFGIMSCICHQYWPLIAILRVLRQFLR